MENNYTDVATPYPGPVTNEMPGTYLYPTHNLTDRVGYEMPTEPLPNRYEYTGAGVATPALQRGIEEGYAGYICSDLKHYFECRHAKVCNCGRVAMAPSVDEGQ